MTIDTPGPDRPKRSVKQWKDISPAERKRNVIGSLGTLALCGVLGWWINSSNKRDEAVAVATQTAEAIGALGTATAEQVGLATVGAEKAGTQQASDAMSRAAPPTSTTGAEAGAKGLPGLTFGFIRALAGTEGFSCDGSAETGFTWYCTKETDAGMYEFSATGPSASLVQAVTASVTMKGGGDPTDAALELLPLVASLEYDGSDPEAAMAWARSVAGKDLAETDFGPAHFISRWPANAGTAILDIEGGE